VRNFVDGKFADAQDGRTSDLIDPAHGTVFGTAPISTPADVDTAMQAAASAFESWKRTTPSERQKALLKIADAMEARAGEFVDAEVLNTGKPRASVAADEVPPAVDRIRFFAGAARVLEAAPPPSTCRATPRSSGASQSGSAARSRRGTTR
jgi:betaine-aldehyde dehydrogenase